MKFKPGQLVIVCAAIAAFVSGAWVHAQVASMPVNPPIVLSGADIGFRMTGRKGDVPVGDLVVRVNNEWKRVEFTYAMRPLTK